LKELRVNVQVKREGTTVLTTKNKEEEPPQVVTQVASEKKVAQVADKEK
jgi:hypothetical protein